MIFSNENVLSSQQLKRIAEHVYSSSGSTLLDPWMQKFWNWFVTHIPLWVAPNLMTIVGLAINALTTLILICLSPDARDDVPAWAPLFFALGLFIYQTLDACDGKQARRTGSSSPLGELFDHGCDSLSTVFVAIATCVSVQLGHYPNWMLYQCLAASILFYTAHWQTYVSGTLKFGKFDVTEAQFTIIVIHMVSAIFGTQIWSLPVSIGVLEFELKLVPVYITFLGASYPICCYVYTILYGGVGKNGSTIAIPVLNFQLKLMPVAFAAVTHLGMIISQFSTIFSGGVGKNGSTVAGTSILSPLIPILVVIVPAVVIFKKSPTNLYETNPCLYLLTFGLVIAKVAHMTKSEIEILDSVLIGPTMLFLNQYFNTFISEYIVLWLAFFWTIADLLWYAGKVCLEISSHLQINIFSIKPRQSSSSVSRPDRGRTNPAINGRPDNSESSALLCDEEGSDDDSDSRSSDVLYRQTQTHPQTLRTAVSIDLEDDDDKSSRAPPCAQILPSAAHDFIV